MCIITKLIPPDTKITFHKIDDEQVFYEGYRFTLKGTVYKGAELLKIRKCNNGRSYVYIVIGGKRYQTHLAKMIYLFFGGEKSVDFRKYIIQYLDGNPDNCSYDNLFLVPKTANLKCKQRKRKKISYEDVQKIRAAYKPPGKHINQHNKDKAQKSIRDLAKEYRCSKNVIQRIVHDQY